MFDLFLCTLFAWAVSQPCSYLITVGLSVSSVRYSPGSRVWTYVLFTRQSLRGSLAVGVYVYSFVNLRPLRCTPSLTRDDPRAPETSNLYLTVSVHPSVTPPKTPPLTNTGSMGSLEKDRIVGLFAERTLIVLCTHTYNDTCQHDKCSGFQNFVGFTGSRLLPNSFATLCVSL